MFYGSTFTSSSFQFFEYMKQYLEFKHIYFQQKSVYQTLKTTNTSKENCVLLLVQIS